VTSGRKNRQGEFLVSRRAPRKYLSLGLTENPVALPIPGTPPPVAAGFVQHVEFMPHPPESLLKPPVAHALCIDLTTVF